MQYVVFWSRPWDIFSFCNDHMETGSHEDRSKCSRAIVVIIWKAAFTYHDVGEVCPKEPLLLFRVMFYLQTFCFFTVLEDDDDDDDNAELSDEEAADGDANETKQRQRRQQVSSEWVIWNTVQGRLPLAVNSGHLLTWISQCDLMLWKGGISGHMYLFNIIWVSLSLFQIWFNSMPAMKRLMRMSKWLRMNLNTIPRVSGTTC